MLTDLARLAAEKSIEEMISSALNKELTRANSQLFDIVKLTFKEDGTVSSLKTDTKALLSLRTSLLLSVLGELDREQALKIEVPYASLFGLNFFPSDSAFPVNIRLTKSINAYFTGEFYEMGINQTIHRISFTVSITALLMVPQKNQAVTVTRRFPMSETVLLGSVPDAYTKIHRLTDDITESELDDIYDFGASSALE